jgi:hypothetical protein
VVAVARTPRPYTTRHTVLHAASPRLSAQGGHNSIPILVRSARGKVRRYASILQAADGTGYEAAWLTRMLRIRGVFRTTSGTTYVKEVLR